MTVSARHMLAALALVLSPGVAAAQCHCGAGAAPPPPPPPPPSHACCTQGAGGPRIGVTVSGPVISTASVVVTSPTVIVNHSAPAIATAVSISGAGANAGSSSVVYVGGGGGYVGGFTSAPAIGMVSFSSETDTSAAAAVDSTAAAISRIEAICMDDRATPHPASQTFAGETVPGSYRGEIYRCIAGTFMRYTIAGASSDCAKNEALVYDGEKVVCATQEVRRPCNERSLLRRFGPGAKMASLRGVQHATARREVLTARGNSQMSLDGGVGQGAW